MKTRPADQPYCGVNPAKIKAAKPVLNLEALKLYAHMVKERYAVRIKKDVKRLPPPWTNDPILRDFRFTNVRREHDRETLWLLNHITNNPRLSYANKILNSLLFRLFNKHETMEVLGTWIDFTNLTDAIKDNLRFRIKAHEAANPTYVWFTNAFITGGLKRAAGSDILVVRKGHKVQPDEQVPVKMSAWLVKNPSDPPAVYLTEKEAIKFCDMNPDYEWYEAKEMDMRMRMINMVEKMYKDGFLDKLNACENQKAVFDLLTGYNGIAGFLGYQIFVDFTYIEEFPFSENEFTIAGPGCMNGLNILFVEKDGMTYEECLFWVRDNFEEIIQRHYGFWSWYDIFEDLSEDDRRGNVMSIENTMCEFSKYHRAWKGTGRPRNKYKRSNEALPGDTEWKPPTVGVGEFLE